jgi:hypothetical protein
MVVCFASSVSVVRRVVTSASLMVAAFHRLAELVELAHAGHRVT